MCTRLFPTLDRPAGGAGRPWERHNSATGSYGCTSCAVHGRRRGESVPCAARARRSRAPSRARRRATVGGKRGQCVRRGFFGARAPSSAAAAGSWAAPGLPHRRHPQLPPRAEALRRFRAETKCRRQRSRASFADPRAPPREAPSAAGGAACVRRREPQRCNAAGAGERSARTHRCVSSSVNAQRSRSGAVGTARRGRPEDGGGASEARDDLKRQT